MSKLILITGISKGLGYAMTGGFIQRVILLLVAPVHQMQSIKYAKSLVLPMISHL
ncbi:MAG: hypothetical protein V7L30_12080 [Nostoc sp.]|uniref:hypothetical protein n=1 Tax=Nostoc sp. TaxID=1180 RepID=UPI002FF6FC22